jgi:hypothetical protein
MVALDRAALGQPDSFPNSRGGASTSAASAGVTGNRPSPLDSREHAVSLLDALAIERVIDAG